MKDFSEKLSRTPSKPGVYLMKDGFGAVIYVGKAKNLKKRLSSYFASPETHNRKTLRLVLTLDDFEYIITNSEIEALILEANLIKKHLPHFNILLKDDKSFPYLKLTAERFPRLIKTREMKKDGEYFGPYTSVKLLNRHMDLIKRLYKLRKCSRNMSRVYPKPCLYFHLNMCLAPCVNKEIVEPYAAEVSSVGAFLKKSSNDLISILKEEMKEHAEKQNYEQAALIRDEIVALQKVDEEQVVTDLSIKDADVIALARREENAMIVILFIREGRLTDREKYLIYGSEDESDAEIVRQFVMQYYRDGAYIPKYIDLAREIEDMKDIEAIFGERRGSNVSISVPGRGRRKKLVEMALVNAKEVLDRELEQELEKKNEKENNIRRIQEILSLDKMPRRIELYDISNTFGSYVVGAMVVFQDGERRTQNYRKFKIRTEGRIDDYASTTELLFRRLKRTAIDEDENFGELPDLIFMDGGKGHVGAALDVTAALGLNIEVAGLVKDDRHTTRAIYHREKEIPLDRHSKLYPFLASMQEEVHRFAIDYHRSLRAKGMLKSELDGIKGIGEKRKAAILKNFGSVESALKATYDELIEIPEINKQVAESIIEYAAGRKKEKQ